MTIEREITIGNIRLIQGDMTQVLPGLDLQADMVLSDPPYRIVKGGNKTGEMRGCMSRDQYDNSGELFPIVEWHDMAPLFYNALAKDADAVVMTSDREGHAARTALQDAGFGFHRTLIWNKGTATPNRYYMPDCEFGLYMWKGRARTISDCGSKALTRYPHSDVSHLYIPKSHYVDGRRPAGHPTEKPVGLLRKWLTNSTDAGGLVLDPFFGSGSTLVAAALSGRAAVGIELNPMWFDVAVARVREAVEAAQFDLFENRPDSAVQGALQV
ncbi:DNA-methyltransferase [Pseudooceanicola sp. MF1-13]|uniref:DNA-methyltransferase n=1 Tax=Pseudooceanicola sp. MF1-13 TaxID=3379095 RepID=UPI003892B49B